jgi:pimeloyl-ACP methyl ester carboxylesterase
MTGINRPLTRDPTPFRIRTEDGIVLRGHRLGSDTTALVFCHGFMGWSKPKLFRFQREMARHFSVFAFDFRGHGRSEGRSAFGTEEHLDVEAAVRLARSEGCDRVVTFGASMGGIAVIGHAAWLGGVDAAVAVSTPARWEGHDSSAVRRLIRYTGSRSGRWLLRAGRVRVIPAWDRPVDPADLVGDISPIPLIVVHSHDDHFFDVEEAWTLYRNARPPKRLLLAPVFGHAQDGFTPAFAERVADTVRSVLGPWPPEPARGEATA